MKAEVDPLTAMRRLPAARSGPARKPKAQRTLTAMDGSAGVKTLTDEMAQEWAKAQAQAAAMQVQEEEIESEPEPEPEAKPAADSAPPAVRPPPLVRSRTMARRSMTAEEQAERDAASEEEWERRVGIRAPAPAPFATTIYASIDEPLPALPAVSSSSLRFSATTTLPLAATRRTAPRPAAPIVDPQLYSLDVERSRAITPVPAALVDPALASSASASALHVSNGKPPVIRMGDLVEMGRRSAAAQPVPFVPAEEKMSWRMHSEEEEKESNQRSLAHAASTPNLPSVTGDVAPEYRFVGTPSLAVLQFLKSNVPVSEVLTPRARYDLLARSAQQIMPESPAAAADPAARTDSRPMTAVGAVPSVHGLSAEMHQLSVRARAGPLQRQRSEDISPLGSARSMVSSGSAAGAGAPAGAPPLARQISWGQYRDGGAAGGSGGGGGSSMLSARSALADDDSLPGSPSPGGAVARRARARAEILARVGDRTAGDRHIRSLKQRPKLPSQFVEETESSPLSALASMENIRVTRALRPKSSSASAVVLAGSKGFKQEYSSAALLAAQEVHGIRVEPPPPPPAASTKQRDKHGKHARAPVQQQAESETAQPAVDAATVQRKRGAVDPELVAAAAASRGLLVTRPGAPSPAPSQGGHRYMKTHALHHHLPLDLAVAGSSPAAAAAGAKRRSQGGDSSLLGLDTHLIEEHGFDAEIAIVSATRSAEPLPSSSPALHMTSPSSKPDWQPPSLACTALAEEIYATSRRGLTHIVSAGEGEEALERHLVAIRPARVTESLRKQAMAAAAIQSMQAAAASKQARLQRAAAEASALALSKKKAADAQLKRKQIEAARELKAALAAGLDSADLPTSLATGGSTATASSNGSAGADLAPSADESSTAVASAPDNGEPASHQHWERVKHSDLGGSSEHHHAHAHGSLARSGSLSILTVAPEPKVVNFSRHRLAASATGGSAYGPAGEDLHERASRTVAPASYAAGHMLDSSVAAASESVLASSEAKRLAAINEYNAVLARLYKNVTPQQKRLKRLDMPGANREDVRRVVAESLGLHDPNARKRFQ